jgi:hypothetical protein
LVQLRLRPPFERCLIRSWGKLTPTSDERYAPFLRTLPETDDDAATALAGDTLSPAAKTALVLESRADIVEAEKGLREIDVYNKRGVAGADGLDGE